jgi:hypothetical protein
MRSCDVAEFPFRPPLLPTPTQVLSQATSSILSAQDVLNLILKPEWVAANLVPILLDLSRRMIIIYDSGVDRLAKGSTDELPFRT